jgi:RNA polymerase sigma factor (sigma-70 family)
VASASVNFLRHLRGLLAARRGGWLPDRQLLQRFVARREETAFSELVRRHGPMVLGVCRSVLGNHQDAEDACQATFLVLARKAGSIRKAGSLASWLHGVAYRLASRAKVSSARRQAHERRAGDRPPPGPMDELTWRELRHVLHEELGRLPETYRLPLVLCYLEGQTQEEAARQLGWTAGAVKGRLDRGRDLLRRRLTRRGLALAVPLSAAALSQATAAPLPAALVDATARSAALFRAGEAVAGLASEGAAALAEGGLKAMLGTKLKVWAGLVLALGVLAAGAGLAAHQARPAGRPDPGPDGGPETAARGAEPPGSGATRPARADHYGDPLPPATLARLGTVRLRQGGHTVAAVAFAPDGKALLSGGYGDEVAARLWDPSTGRELRTFGGRSRHSGYSAALAPDGKTLATACGADDAAIRLWDAATGKELRRFGGQSTRADEVSIPGWPLAFSPDGKTLAAANRSDPLSLWEVATGARLRQFGQRELGTTCFAFSPDGKTLASGGFDGQVHLWDVATGQECRRCVGHQRYIGGVAFSPDGRVLASGSYDETIRLWDSGTGKELRRFGRPAPGDQRLFYAVAFSPDGKLLASGSSDYLVRLWDVATGKEVRQLEGHQGAVWSVAFSADGRVLASGGDGGTIRLWDTATGKALPRAGGPESPIRCLAVSPDGRTLASGGDQDETVRLWEAGTGKELRRLQVREGPVLEVQCAAFSPDGKALAAGTNYQGQPESNYEVQVWEAATGKALSRFKGRGHIRALAYSPGGRLLALSSYWEKNICLWDVAAGKELGRFRDEVEHVDSLALSPDGKTLASGNRQGTLRLWDVAAGTERGRFDDLPGNWQALAFSPDGKAVVSGSAPRRQLPRDGLGGGLTGGRPDVPAEYARVLCLREVATGRELRRFGGHAESVFCAAFSPDGHTLASGTAGGMIHLWEVLTGKERLRLEGHRGAITCLRFSADGRALVSGSSDNTVLVWDATGRAHGGGSQAAPLRPDELEALWKDLAGEDAARAYRALGRMATAPDQSVRFLRGRLQPAPPSDARVARLIADLDRDQYAARAEAARGLEGLGAEAEPALRQALAARPSPEVRRRLEQLLEQLPRAVPPPERLRALRALEAVERAGTAEARQVLQRMAQGAPGARLTQEARSALQRLARVPQPGQVR